MTVTGQAAEAPFHGSSGGDHRGGLVVLADGAQRRAREWEHGDEKEQRARGASWFWRSYVKNESLRVRGGS